MFSHLTWKLVLILAVAGIAPILLYKKTKKINADLCDDSERNTIATLVILPVIVSALSWAPDVIYASIIYTLLYIYKKHYMDGAEFTPYAIYGIALLHIALPKTVSIFSTLLALEFSSIITTIIVVNILYGQNWRKSISDLVYPILLYNFVTYFIIIIIAVVYVNKVGPSETTNIAMLQGLTLLYVLLKFNLTPLLVAKAPTYSNLSIHNLFTMTLPQLIIATPQIYFIHSGLIALPTVALIPIYLLSGLLICYNILHYRDIKHLLLYSTPLFMVTLLVAIL